MTSFLLLLHSLILLPSILTLSLPLSHISLPISPIKSTGTSIYVHIPFCRRRCSYCDFTILPVGSNDGKIKNKDASLYEIYRDVLRKEIERVGIMRSEAESAKRSLPNPIKTLYFGGGTPSLLPPPLLLSLLSTLKSSFPIAPDAEVTIECDPGTFNLGDIKTLKEGGFNRFSIGETGGSRRSERRRHTNVFVISPNATTNTTNCHPSLLPAPSLQEYKHSTTKP